MMFFHLETIKPITFLRLETTKLTTPRSAWSGVVGKAFLCLSLLLCVVCLWGCRSDCRNKIDAALQAGHNQQAMTLLNQAIADTATAEWLWKRAELETKLGKDADALRDYHRLLRLHSVKDGAEFAAHVDITADSSVNVNEVFSRQLAAYFRLGQMRLAENKLEQMRKHLYDKGQVGKYYYWKGLIAKGNKEWYAAYSSFREAALLHYPDARLQLKEMSKQSGMPLNWPTDLDSMNVELQFTDGTRWPIANKLQGQPRLVKVECKRVEVTNIRRFVLKNYLDAAVLHAIPGMAARGKQLAPVCVATASGHNLCFTCLPGSSQLAKLGLDASEGSAKPNAQLAKPQVIEVWVMKYEDAQGQRNCKVYIK